jgi:hypothetical protein
VATRQGFVYSWVGRAVDTKGNPSAASNTVTYKTPPDTTPPSAPTLSALYVGPKLVELDWTDSVDDASSGVTYLVNRNGSSTPYGNLSYAVVGWRLRPRTRSASPRATTRATPPRATRSR